LEIFLLNSRIDSCNIFCADGGNMAVQPIRRSRIF
jgi:hypothetical protein